MSRKKFHWADHECNKYCKVHNYYDFNREMHWPFPHSWNILTQSGWYSSTVFVGPPGYNPRKPTPEQWNLMKMVCPHNPPQLTCNTCQRHTFRRREFK